MSEDAGIQASQQLPDRRTLDTEEVREKRRADVITRVRRAEQKLQIAGREIRMVERWREAVELFPIRFVNQWTHLFPERRAGIWRQDFELCKSRAELDRVIDCLGN